MTEYKITLETPSETHGEGHFDVAYFVDGRELRESCEVDNLPLQVRNDITKKLVIFLLSDKIKSPKKVEYKFNL